MKIHRPAHATVIAYTALFFAMSGTAVAATGNTFITGRSNVATTVTTLTDSAGTPLSLAARSGYAPLAVNSTVKVGRLNADLLDGLDSTSLQRRIGGACPAGQAITSITPDGGVACASTVDASTLGGQSASAFQTRIGGACPSGYAMVGVNSDGTVTCTLLSPPPPAPAPAQSSDKGFSITDLQLSADSSNDWKAVARITNTTASTRSGSFTVTVFNGAGSVIATLSGSVSSLAASNANTVTFYSFDTYSSAPVTTTFQTDSAYNG